MSTEIPAADRGPTRRRTWYRAPGRQQRLRQPVVSVGNLAAGGRGKTPVVAHLARLLLDAGERPAILSRGYGRREVAPGAVVVSDGTRVLASLDAAGDEPLMLARALPGVRVVVCDDRRIAGALAETHLGATVHVLDDGFQHLPLARDVDLVLVSAADLTARAFPLGPLRESPRALSDAVVLRGTEDFSTDPGVSTSVPETPGSVEKSSVPLRVVRAFAGPPPPAGPAVAVAGIARPDRFFQDLIAAGWTLAARLAFRDHHRYRPADLAAIADTARSTGAVALVTTAKDAVRLPSGTPFPVPLAVADVTATIEPAAAFRAWLLERLARARR